MKWIKKGLLFEPNQNFWWSKSFAGIPTAELISEDTIRLYYYSMDEHMDGRISYIEVSAQNPSEIRYIHPEPIIDIGGPGDFDDCGVCTGFVIKRNGLRHMYYIGVQRAVKVPYMYFAGLAIENKEGIWEKNGRTPLLERTSEEPCIRSATTMVEVNGELKMWYVSAFRWIEVNGKRVPNYVIRHSVSTDGLNWQNKGGIAINFKNDDEFGFGRPWAIFENGIYKMWYSIRSISKNYRIGYAESADGMNWTRMDEEVGIDVSAEGWDSQMICYPSIVDAAGKRYMFHNGNGHGLSGFGYAVLES